MNSGNGLANPNSGFVYPSSSEPFMSDGLEAKDECHEVRCPQCNFLVGFSSGEGTTIGSGFCCHYCAIERAFLTNFLSGPRPDNGGNEPDFGTEKWWEWFISRRDIRTAAFYGAQIRDRQMNEVLSGIVEIKGDE